MRRTLVSVAAALVAAIAVPAAAGAYELSDELLQVLATAPLDRGVAVGEGRFSTGQPSDQFILAARGTPLEASGSIRLAKEGFAEIRGRVGCVFVFGGFAGVAGTLDQPVGEYGFFSMAVVDNGEPGGGVPDAALYELRTAPSLTGDCGLVSLLSLGAPSMLHGNVVLRNK